MNQLNGTYAMMMAMVAVKTGTNSSRTLFHAAVHGSRPWSSFSTWSSMMTIALSTTIPSTTISPASETVWSSTPSAARIPSVMKTQMGIVMAATLATRSGSSSIVTRMTETIAMPKSRRK